MTFIEWEKEVRKELDTLIRNKPLLAEYHNQLSFAPLTVYHQDGVTPSAAITAAIHYGYLSLPEETGKAEKPPHVDRVEDCLTDLKEQINIFKELVQELKQERKGEKDEGR